MPGVPTRSGQSATIGGIKIVKGSTIVVDDRFASATLDETRWVVRARDPGGVFPVPSDVGYLLRWDLPDTGFALKSSASIQGPWADYGTPLTTLSQRIVPVNQPPAGAPNAFFLLVKP